MENINELSAYLNLDHHPDTWAEYSSGYASELLEKFTDEEWDSLKRTWKDQPISWQRRLTDILYSATSDRKYEVLEMMVMTADDPVRMYAVEALDLNTPVYKVPDHIADHLRSLQQSGISSDLDDMITALLSHQKE